MSLDAWLLIVGATVISWLAGYGYGWRDGFTRSEELEGNAMNSEGWMGEALEWRALIKEAAMRDMKLGEPPIHEDKFA